MSQISIDIGGKLTVIMVMPLCLISNNETAPDNTYIMWGVSETIYFHDKV